MPIKKLNLGCGRTPIQGWINLDIADIPGVDIVYDINNLPLPFQDGELDEILCNDIFEHLEYIPVLKDLHRILKPGGILTIQVPHFTSRDNFIDPTHLKRFSVRTFDYFISDALYERDYYFDFKFSRLESCKVTFLKKFPLTLNYLTEFMVNINIRMIDLYEVSGWSRLFPAHNIIFKIRK